ncbi:hypothetical protein C8R44DRAFT_858965 [Mycena epipterygia]|nr:hypothetical protein C8R44DRAFT_858965 [Mycena epipterygia]
MQVSYTPRPSVYPRPKPAFKRQKTTPDSDSDSSSRSVSPADSFYSDGRMRSHERAPRSASPTGSFYSHSSASSPSIDSASASSCGSNKAAPLPIPPVPSLPRPLPIASSWLTRSPRSPRSLPALDVVSRPAAAEFASAQFASTADLDTPTDVPQAELRRRQLEKATRILGEGVPLELVFQPRDPLLKSFPDPPPRQATESPVPVAHHTHPRELFIQRARKGSAGKIVRRASLSLSTLTSKFRATAPSMHFMPSSHTHTRDSSRESQTSASASASASASSSSSDHSLSPASPTPITFAFPPQPLAHVIPPVPVLDIRNRSASASATLHDDTARTPVRRSNSHSYSSRRSNSHSSSLPRVVPMPPQDHDADHLPPRAETPFADYTPARSETPFADYADTPAPAPQRGGAQGWSGEWNRQDMQDVIHRLRTLNIHSVASQRRRCLLPVALTVLATSTSMSTSMYIWFLRFYLDHILALEGEHHGQDSDVSESEICAAYVEAQHLAPMGV